MRYEILSHRHLTEADRKTGITGDFTIRLTTKSVYLYPEPIRAVCVYDEEAGETGEEIVFITNNFDISASEVACLYRQWIAIITYLILAKIKADYKSPYSVTEVATLVRISALEKTSLRDLVTKPRDSVNLNQSVKELTLF